MGVKTTARTTSDMIMPGRKLFIHSRYVCGESAVKSFFCHYRHSSDTYNELRHNVFTENVKSDSKSKMNFCCKQSAVLSLLSASFHYNFQRNFLSIKRVWIPQKYLLGLGYSIEFMECEIKKEQEVQHSSRAENKKEVNTCKSVSTSYYAFRTECSLLYPWLTGEIKQAYCTSQMSFVSSISMKLW